MVTSRLPPCSRITFLQLYCSTVRLFASCAQAPTGLATAKINTALRKMLIPILTLICIKAPAAHAPEQRYAICAVTVESDRAERCRRINADRQIARKALDRRDGLRSGAAGRCAIGAVNDGVALARRARKGERA